LAVLHLGGFGGSRNRNILNVSSLWERRARHKKLMILKEKQVESYKTNNDQRKLNKDSKVYRRQGMLGVEVTSS
jgi:hypothetical protein